MHVFQHSQMKSLCVSMDEETFACACVLFFPCCMKNRSWQASASGCMSGLVRISALFQIGGHLNKALGSFHRNSKYLIHHRDVERTTAPHAADIHKSINTAHWKHKWSQVMFNQQSQLLFISWFWVWIAVIISAIMFLVNSSGCQQVCVCDGH